MEREFHEFHGIWDAFVDQVDADTSKLNQRLNHHREQYNEMRGWCRSAEEVAGRHEQQIERLPQDNQTLGEKGGVLGRYTVNTLQGNG